MTKASDNPYPSILVAETAGASVGTPSTGQQRLYIDSTSHTLYRKNSGGTMTEIAGGGMAAGTTFPGSPSTNDRYFRTDLGREYFWNATYWVSSETFTLQQSVSNISANVSAYYTPAVEDIYIISFDTAFFVNGTNNGSNYWTGYLSKSASNNTLTTVTTRDTSAGSGSTWIVGRTTLTSQIVFASYPVINTQMTPTGSPGNLFGALIGRFRLIAT